MGDNTLTTTICYRMNQLMKFPNPPTRISLQTPYSRTNPKGTSNENSEIYTQAQLDMRRKAEILKYAGSQKSNYIGQLTRKQKFSQIVRGVRPNQRAEQINTDCESVPTLSTRSGVPGKPMMLFLDKRVPLYNYATNIRSYSTLPVVQPFPFRVFLFDGIDAILPNTPTKFAGVEILDKIPNAVTTFELSIPYTIVDATTFDTTPILEVLYGNSPIIYNSTFTYDTTTTPGILQIKNIKVFTTVGYFYEFRLTLDKRTILDFTKISLTSVSSSS